MIPAPAPLQKKKKKRMKKETPPTPRLQIPDIMILIAQFSSQSRNWGVK